MSGRWAAITAAAMVAGPAAKTTAASPHQATRLPDYDACLAAFGGSDGAVCRRGFASFHSGGANAVFADGSVRFLSTNLGGRVFMALASIAGGEVLPDF